MCTQKYVSLKSIRLSIYGWYDKIYPERKQALMESICNQYLLICFCTTTPGWLEVISDTRGWVCEETVSRLTNRCLPSYLQALSFKLAIWDIGPLCEKMTCGTPQCYGHFTPEKPNLKPLWKETLLHHTESIVRLKNASQIIVKTFSKCPFISELSWQQLSFQSLQKFHHFYFNKNSACSKLSFWPLTLSTVGICIWDVRHIWMHE